jgi:hypothetical protein
MECLKSFSFLINKTVNLTGADAKTWTTGTAQHFWAATTGAVSSTYNIEGFRNINVYGVDLVGTVQTLATAVSGQCIVNDWNIELVISGNQPLINSNITASPNYYNISNNSTNNNQFALGRFNNTLKFASPIESVKFFQLGTTTASGWGYNNSADINLFWNLNLVIYYDYEGD